MDRLSIAETQQNITRREEDDEEDLINNEENLIDRQISDFEMEDELNESHSNNNDLIISSLSALNMQSSNQDLRNENVYDGINHKLDTIKESSINELMQVNIKKLHLNEKYKESISINNNNNNSNVNQQILQPPNSTTSTHSAQSNKTSKTSNKPPSSSNSSSNTSISKSTVKQPVKKADSQTKLNPPLPKQINTKSSAASSSSRLSTANQPIKSQNIITKSDRSKSIDSKQSEKHATATSVSTNKAQLNLDLFTPAPVQNDSNKQTSINESNSKKNVTNSVGILKKRPTQSTISKSNSSNKLNIKEQTPAIARIDSSRIEVNKKSSIKPIVKLDEKKVSSASIATDISTNTNLTTVTALTNQSENDANSITPNTPIHKKSDASTLNDFKLEITSSRINLTEKPPPTLITSATSSAHHNNNHPIISDEMNRLLSAANKLNKLPDPSVFMERNYSNNNLNVDKPTQPFIVTMYEDYPQPFTSKSINYISSANLQTKKVKMTKKPKYNNKQRISSGSKTASKSKQKNQGASSSSKTNTKSKSNKSKNKGGSKKEEEEETETTLPTEMNETLTEDINNKNDDENTLKNETTNYETDEFEAESADSSLSDDDENDKSNAISDNDENGNLKHSTSENDIYLKSLGESTSEEVIIKKTNNINNKKSSLNENAVAAAISPSATKLNKDMIQSFEDRVFAIYNKFDILLSQQETILDSKANPDLSFSKSKEANERLIELNEQKVQFSQEMARELSENVNFDEITSNPELVKRLKSLYKLVKTNGTANENENDNDKVLKNKKPPLPEFSKNSISKKTDNCENNNANLLKPRRSSVTFASIKSNADIREVYSMINSMGSKNENENNLENTVKSNKNNSLYSTKTLTNKIYKLPDNLSDKINDLMVPLQISEENKNDEEDSNELTIKPGAEVTESFEEPDFNLEQVSKLKINYVSFNKYNNFILN